MSSDPSADQSPIVPNDNPAGLDEKIVPAPDSPVLKVKRATSEERIGRGREYLAYLIGAILLILVCIAGAGFLLGRNLEPLVPIIATIATLTGSVLAFYFASTNDSNKTKE